MRILVAGFDTREKVNAAMDKFIAETGILMITIICGGQDSAQHSRSFAEEWARENGASIEYIFERDFDKLVRKIVNTIDYAILRRNGTSFVREIILEMRKNEKHGVVYD